MVMLLVSYLEGKKRIPISSIGGDGRLEVLLALLELCEDAITLFGKEIGYLIPV